MTTTTEYNDPLLRPTRTYVTPAGFTGETLIEYGDGDGNPSTADDIFIKTKTQIDAANYAETTKYFDGLGRAIKTKSKDSQGDVFTETQYDLMSRVWKVSNPYRMGETLLWTTTTYDEAGRIKKVTTPDNAEVETFFGLSTTGSYIGTTTTVEDQADKKRRSITDALGRLMRVDEPDTNGNLGDVGSPTQPTFYEYDLLGNLKTVTQGEQTRTFVYDSLSRLLSATNPESGIIKYSYDSNSNLISKLDARNIKTTYAYDALNRVVTRSYFACDSQGQNCVSDSTPQVNYFYDGTGLSQTPVYSKGKLTKVSSSVSATEYSTFDAAGRITQSKQITDGQSYQMSYTYNLAGALTSQTYPSGRVVTNQFDTNGQLANMSSKQNTNATPRTYANAFTYAPSGAVSSMRLGNGRFESTVFNSRLQPTQIALGTSAFNTSLLKLNYDYGTTDNNGNVKSQTITVPGMSHPLIQTYTYDSLNRLQSATETSNNTQTWKQTFSFDRYGNRRFDTSNNNTTTLPSGYDPNVFNPTFNPSTNRMNDNQGYDYDLAGNVTKDATDKRFIYDAENKQTSFGTNGSSTNGGSYFYDGDGKRIKKIVGTETTIFVYNASGQMVAEYSTTAPTNPQTSYLTTDTLGSPRINTNASGQVAARHDYLPFGEEINAGVGGRTTNQGYPQPLAEMANGIKNKFTGQIRDGESGLDYFLARYYSNKHGRFTSVDPENEGAIPEYPQSWNGYAYVINRPLVLTDPDGRDFRICDLNGECVVVSDEFAKTVTFNKDWQKQSGYYTKGDGKFYSSADGSVIGTYRNLGCDCWPDWNKAVVNEVDEQIRNPLTWIAGAAGAVFSTKIRPIKPSNLPSSSKMYIDMNEVLSGHTKTGNRAIQSATNAGTKNAKDLFPDGWTPTQIEEAIWDAYEHSKKVQTQGDRVRVRGVTRSGMIIEMWVNVKDKIIETAYPKGYVNK